MTAAVSDLARFRTDPAQPGAWLKTFRRATPRPQRQALIDQLDVGAFVEQIAQLPPELRDPEKYPLVLYILAARKLETPAASGPAAREAIRGCVARVFGLDPLDVARDITRMVVQLRHDHQRWQVLQQRRQENGAQERGR